MFSFSRSAPRPHAVREDSEERRAALAALTVRHEASGRELLLCLVTQGTDRRLW